MKLKQDDPEALNDLAYVLAERKAKPEEALHQRQNGGQTRTHGSSPTRTPSRGCTGRAATIASAPAHPWRKSRPPRSNPEFEYHLGVIYSEQHKNEEAIAAFERALKLDPHYQPASEARDKLAGPG